MGKKNNPSSKFLHRIKTCAYVVIDIENIELVLRTIALILCVVTATILIPIALYRHILG